MYQACAVAFACAFVALALFTRSARLAALATSTVLAIVLVLFGFMVGVMQWHFGAIEAVSMIIFIGYAVDYTMHIAQIFHRTHDDLAPRRAGVLCSLAACTSALSVDCRTLSVARPAAPAGDDARDGRRDREPATTTTLSSVFLLCRTIIVFNRMGIIVVRDRRPRRLHRSDGFTAFSSSLSALHPFSPGANGCRPAREVAEPSREPPLNRRIVAVGIGHSLGTGIRC